MRTERNKDGTHTVWFSREEYRAIPRAADSFEHEIAIRLMGDCDLRVTEILGVTPSDISRMDDGRHYELEITNGKDTTGNYDGGKQRETWLPVEVEATINRYVREAGLEDDNPLIQRSKRTVQYWVENAADRAVEETGNDDYRRVSTHDLRRCWANHLLVEENVSPRIMMALGGWLSYDAIEPYLAAPIEANIIESMSAVEL
ncbi:site-specific integrase [Haladaptatus halobius]|uniref:site-specific integrase n=1 Tax=Haladaptatus halobius TaxID=2884875 RepID=UPI001D0A2221|nr:site-specific integrase [Haladaptatus halobius]